MGFKVEGVGSRGYLPEPSAQSAFSQAGTYPARPPPWQPGLSLRPEVFFSHPEAGPCGPEAGWSRFGPEAGPWPASSPELLGRVRPLAWRALPVCVLPRSLPTSGGGGG